MLDFRISYPSKAGFQKHVIAIENWISETHITSKTPGQERSSSLRSCQNPPVFSPRLSPHREDNRAQRASEKNTKKKTHPKPWPHPLPVVRGSPLPSIPRRPLPSPPFHISPLPSIRTRPLPSPVLLDLPSSLPTKRTAAATHIRTDVYNRCGAAESEFESIIYGFHGNMDDDDTDDDNDDEAI